MPVRAPIPCTTTSSGRLAVTRGSFWRNEPAAPFRGLANNGFPASSSASFISLNCAMGKKTSPRTSISSGIFLPLKLCGKDLMVLTFKVTSSPVVPLPRVNARVNRPFSNLRLIARPSTLSSHKYCGFGISFSTRSNQALNSARSKTLSRLIIFSM